MDATTKIIHSFNSLLNMIDAHEVTCFSCDNDGETYCDCIKRETDKIKKMIDEELNNEKH